MSGIPAGALVNPPTWLCSLGAQPGSLSPGPRSLSAAFGRAWASSCGAGTHGLRQRRGVWVSGSGRGGGRGEVRVSEQLAWRTRRGLSGQAPPGGTSSDAWPLQGQGRHMRQSQRHPPPHAHTSAYEPFLCCLLSSNTVLFQQGVKYKRSMSN